MTRLPAMREFLRAAHALGLAPDLFFTPAMRWRVAELHAFCRGLDDAVDEAPIPAIAVAALARYAALVPEVAARTGAPPEALAALVEGVRRDLDPVPPASDQDLIDYAHHVSASVAIALATMLGVPRRVHERAWDLGIALQLSNVLRDVHADAARGRIYVPQARLTAAGVPPEELLRGCVPHARLAPALAGLSAVADRFYASAEEGIRDIPLRYRHGVLLLGRVYRAVGRAAVARPYDPRRDGVGVGRMRRAGLVAALPLLALTPGVLGWRPMRPRTGLPHPRLGAQAPGVSPGVDAPRHRIAM